MSAACMNTYVEILFLLLSCSSNSNRNHFNHEAQKSNAKQQFVIRPDSLYLFIDLPSLFYPMFIDFIETRGARLASQKHDIDYLC